MRSLSVACGEELATSRTLTPLPTPGRERAGPDQVEGGWQRSRTMESTQSRLAGSGVILPAGNNKSQWDGAPWLDLRCPPQMPTGLADGFGLRR